MQPEGSTRSCSTVFFVQVGARTFARNSWSCKGKEDFPQNWMFWLKRDQFCSGLWNVSLADFVRYYFSVNDSAFVSRHWTMGHFQEYVWVRLFVSAKQVQIVLLGWEDECKVIGSRWATQPVKFVLTRHKKSVAKGHLTGKADLSQWTGPYVSDQGEYYYNDHLKASSYLQSKTSLQFNCR